MGLSGVKQQQQGQRQEQCCYREVDGSQKPLECGEFTLYRARSLGC